MLAYFVYINVVLKESNPQRFKRVRFSQIRRYTPNAFERQKQGV